MNPATPNHDAWFHSKFEQASAFFESGDHVRADDICRELLADFVCPRMIHAHAWQLRSLCTKHYWDAKAHLLQCFEVLKKVSSARYEGRSRLLVVAVGTMTWLSFFLLRQNVWAPTDTFCAKFQMPDMYKGVRLDDKSLVDMTKTTQTMLDQLESAWQKKWEKRGLPAPTEPVPIEEETSTEAASTHQPDGDIKEEQKSKSDE